MLLGRARTKVFVIGHNKTGTTSMGQALVSLGFRLGDQSAAERLMDDWVRRDFRGIIRHCKSADAFQDIPFSLDYTYQILDHSFPGSKFILTVRNSAREWYDSLIRFHTKIVGKKRRPTADDLRRFPYSTTGWLWRVQQVVYGVDEDSLYDRDVYTRHYEAHNQSVCRYFRHRPGDLLVLNLCDGDAMPSLCGFLNVSGANLTMPHLNRSTEASV